jgi:hypothetical protein
MNFVNSLVVNSTGRTCRELTTVSINPNGIAVSVGPRPYSRSQEPA